jgi:hypothetical protein
LWRHRDNLIQLATLHLQHMQKALDQMNLQIHHVISDLAGTTGLAACGVSPDTFPQELSSIHKSHP